MKYVPDKYIKLVQYLIWQIGYEEINFKYLCRHRPKRGQLLDGLLNNKCNT